MSSGYGVVQRRILALLAQNDADPMRDFEEPPFFRSWTPMKDLLKTKHSSSSWHHSADAGSTRRAIRKLRDAGVVETILLRPVTWWLTDDPATPGARRETRRGVNGRRRTCWRYPARDFGGQQLHVRLALAPDQQERYWAAARRWARR